jgi:hypothetical protein
VIEVGRGGDRYKRVVSGVCEGKGRGVRVKRKGSGVRIRRREKRISS